MVPERAQEIEDAVERTLRSWRPPNAPNSSSTTADLFPPMSDKREASDVLREMPRRRLGHRIETAQVALPMARRVVFKPGLFLPLRRLLVWLWVAIRFFSGNARDFVLGRASVERRAV